MQRCKFYEDPTNCEFEFVKVEFKIQGAGHAGLQQKKPDKAKD